ncbi:hypothetical protein SBA1_1240002 [Candidatus Sulfotelmatobacter kueseliae]|uniref:Uncharacterized protein n=1 Tax=Candidatus Sulfotelmatobacter kueseliae TaxID=2042962 RepID=A0A2U3K3U8_9BACT|nr:hypothetical protein SBA1_1240002 [Candidatus Sulfotelmatobacter kueseliae]
MIRMAGDETRKPPRETPQQSYAKYIPGPQLNGTGKASCQTHGSDKLSGRQKMTPKWGYRNSLPPR